MKKIYILFHVSLYRSYKAVKICFIQHYYYFILFLFFPKLNGQGLFTGTVYDCSKGTALVAPQLLTTSNFIGSWYHAALLFSGLGSIVLLFGVLFFQQIREDLVRAATLKGTRTGNSHCNELF